MTTAITAPPPTSIVDDAIAAEIPRREVEEVEPMATNNPATEVVSVEVEGDAIDKTNATTRAPTRANTSDEQHGWTNSVVMKSQDDDWRIYQDI